MAKKTVSLRLPEEMVEKLSATGSINQAVERDLERLQRIRQASMEELRGKFTSNEWKFLADCFNGTVIDTIFCTNKFAFLAAIEDHANMNLGAVVWEVDMQKFTHSITSLTSAQVEAVYTRIDEFWNSEDQDLEKWSQW